MKIVYVIIAVVILAALGVMFFDSGTTPTENAENGVQNEETIPVENGGGGALKEQETEAPTDNEGAPAPTQEEATETKTFDLTGMNYEFSETEIRVKKGDRVRINFSSTGGFHDWVVEGFNAATGRVNEGESTSVEFVADEAGEFEYYCSVGSHRALGMVGTLIVEE